jgi:hypothetical protein
MKENLVLNHLMKASITVKLILKLINNYFCSSIFKKSLRISLGFQQIKEGYLEDLEFHIRNE